MTRLVTWDGAGLADGHVLAAGDAGSGDTAITGIAGTPAVEDSDSPYGSTGERSFFATNTSANQYVYWDFATKNSVRVRGYLKTPATLASGAINSVSVIGQAATRRAGLSLPGTGAAWSFRVVDGASANVINGSINKLSPSTWCRYEYGLDWLTSTTANYFLKYWKVDGTLLYDSGAVAGNPNGAAPTRVIVGETTTTPVYTLGFAHAAVTDDNTADIGPWDAPITGPVMTRWNGTAEVPVALTRWDGTSEIPLALSRV